MREERQLLGLVEWKDLQLQTMPGFVEEASRLREEVSNLKKEKERLVAASKLMLTLGTEVFDLKATTGSRVGYLQEVKSRTVEAERDLKKSQEQ